MLKKIVAVVVTVTMFFSITAYANTDNSEDVTDVDTLSQLNIIKGNGKGFNENGQIRRSEATAIIVRLLGGEEKIKENPPRINYYNDIDKNMWYAPYINYIANKGIINGYSDYTFRPDEYISEKAVIKMILGVLGYKNVIDFSWDNIFEKAFEYGLVNDNKYKTKIKDNENFTRGEAFNLVKRALETKLKDNEKTLVQTWMDSKRFTRKQIAKAGLDADEIKTEISEINNPNSTSIRVTFNEKVKGINKDNVKIIQKDTDKELKISKVTIKDKLVTIVTSAQSQLKEYVVSFNTVLDQDDFITNDLSVEFKGYKPDEIESNKFLISKIEAVSEDTIKVFFTQPINVIPTLPSYYKIYEEDKLWVDGTDRDSMYIAKIPDSDRGVIIRLLKKNYNIQNIYKLKISGTMHDKTGVKLNDGEGDSMTFPPLVIDNFELERDITYAFSKDVVTIEFNKDVDNQLSGKFQVVGSDGNSIGCVPNLDPTNSKRVLLSMITPLDPNRTYKLHIFEFKDLERSTSLSETNIEFGVDNESVEKLDITLVEPVSNSEIRVYFNRRLYKDSVQRTNFFITSDNDSSFSGDNIFKNYYFNVDENPCRVTLYLDPDTKKMKEGSNYTLKVTDGLKDYLRKSDGELTHQITGVENNKYSPTISNGWILGQHTIKLEFDKPISNTNNVCEFYKVKYKNSDDEYEILTPNLVSVVDNKYVILKMSEELDYSRMYRVEYVQIKDYIENSFTGGSSSDYILEFAY
ncbi:MAG: S-layer homology domain-containing protein [Vallitalea sp.]|jgi:hypothetical protein|nr:S-layer homology domain-containing protein [Vallitalea sp.]